MQNLLCGLTRDQVSLQQELSKPPGLKMVLVMAVLVTIRSFNESGGICHLLNPDEGGQTPRTDVGGLCLDEHS